jgi:hypothetical protein
MTARLGQALIALGMGYLYFSLLLILLDFKQKQMELWPRLTQATRLIPPRKSCPKKHHNG